MKSVDVIWNEREKSRDGALVLICYASEVCMLLGLFLILVLGSGGRLGFRSWGVRVRAAVVF